MRSRRDDRLGIGAVRAWRQRFDSEIRRASTFRGSRSRIRCGSSVIDARHPALRPRRRIHRPDGQRGRRATRRRPTERSPGCRMSRSRSNDDRPRRAQRRAHQRDPGVPRTRAAHLRRAHRIERLRLALRQRAPPVDDDREGDRSVVPVGRVRAQQRVHPVEAAPGPDELPAGAVAARRADGSHGARGLLRPLQRGQQSARRRATAASCSPRSASRRRNRSSSSCCASAAPTTSSRSPNRVSPEDRRNGFAERHGRPRTIRCSNHNFIVSLLDSTSTLGASARSPAAGFWTSPSAASPNARAWRCRCSPRSTRRAVATAPCSSFPSRDHVGQPHAEEGRRHRHRAVGLALRLRRGTGQAPRRRRSCCSTSSTLPSNIWFFRRGLPVKYTGPSLNATQNSVAIEAIEIAHEGIHQVAGVGGLAPPPARSRDWWVEQMDVEIGEVTSTVRAVDGHALLSPQVMQAIVRPCDGCDEGQRGAGAARARPSAASPAASATNATQERIEAVDGTAAEGDARRRPTATGRWTSSTSSSTRPSSRSTRARRSPRSPSPASTRRCCSSCAARTRSSPSTCSSTRPRTAPARARPASRR